MRGPACSIEVDKPSGHGADNRAGDGPQGRYEEWHHVLVAGVGLALLPVGHDRQRCHHANTGADQHMTPERKFFGSGVGVWPDRW